MQNHNENDLEILKEISKRVASLNKEDEVLSFFEELFTESEVNALIKRWVILKELYSGKTQRAIAKEQHISLCKITRGAKIIKDSSSISYKMIKDSYEKNNY